MAVPKKKHRSTSRRSTYIMKQQKKLDDRIERGMREERGATKVAAKKTPAKSKVTKIAA